MQPDPFCGQQSSYMEWEQMYYFWSFYVKSKPKCFCFCFGNEVSGQKGSVLDPDGRLTLRPKGLALLRVMELVGEPPVEPRCPAPTCDSLCSMFDPPRGCLSSLVQIIRCSVGSSSLLSWAVLSTDHRTWSLLPCVLSWAC